MQADTTGKYMGKSSMQVLRILYQTNGMRSLYRGFGPGAGKSTVGNPPQTRVLLGFTNQFVCASFSLLPTFYRQELHCKRSIDDRLHMVSGRNAVKTEFYWQSLNILS